MEAYFIGVLLAWIPLLALTLVLRRHGKVEWPLITGLTHPAVRCMDRRTLSEGWQLPGGAYALGLPIIYGGLVPLSVIFNGWGIVTQIIVGFALYQFFFTSPLFVIGLVKVFLHGLFSDVSEILLEVHTRTCKAVAVTDPIGLIFFFIGKIIPGDDPFERLFDTLTAMHWIDVLPFIILSNLVGNLGRLCRMSGSEYFYIPWLIVKPGYSKMKGDKT